MNRRMFLSFAIPTALAGVVLAEEAKKAPDRLSGVVKSIDKGQMKIEMNPRNSQAVRVIMYDANTKFTALGKPGSADDVQEGMRIVAIGKFEGVNLKASDVSLTARK